MIHMGLGLESQNIQFHLWFTWTLGPLGPRAHLGPDPFDSQMDLEIFVIDSQMDLEVFVVPWAVTESQNIWYLDIPDDLSRGQ